MQIRDDDISYFSKPEELENAWGKWYGKVNIIFSVTPFMVETKEYRIENREFDYHQLGEVEFDIAENVALIKYLKNLLSKHYIQVGLHGYNHKYTLEYDIKDEELLYQKSLKAKEYLEKLLDTKVDTFVPPDNSVSGEAIKALSRAKFKKVLRAFPLKYIDTDFSLRYIVFWVQRVWFKLKYKLVYSKIYYNGYLHEEASYLYKGQDFEKLMNDYKIYKNYNLAFTLATHYWELKGEMKNNLDKFLEKVQINECN